MQCEEYHAAKKAEFEVRVNELVTHVRTAIDELWNEMRAGPQQRQDMFAEFFTEGTCSPSAQSRPTAHRIRCRFKCSARLRDARERC